MIKEKSHDKISYTAILCARSLAENTNIPYAKEIYNILKEKKYARTNHLKFAFLLSKFFKGIQLFHAFLEARFLSMDYTLKKLNYPNVIEVASGLSPRGIIYPGLYIETDLKNMIEIKKKVLADIFISKKDYFLEPLNILDKKQLFNIGKIYRKSNSKKPLAIIHSGLWTYLTKEEQLIMRNNIREFLKKFCKKGYWISQDFRPKSFQKNLFFKFFRGGITKKTGRPTNRFASEEEMISFMNAGGLKVRVLSNNSILNNLNTKKKFNLNIEDIKRQTSDMKMYIIQLK